MDFLSQVQKIAKCEVCGKQFLVFGDMNPEESYFCSAECGENFGIKGKK